MNSVTLKQAVAHFQDKKIILEVITTLKAGKEATVYVVKIIEAFVEQEDDFWKNKRWKNRLLALKVYKYHKFKKNKGKLKKGFYGQTEEEKLTTTKYGVKEKEQELFVLREFVIMKRVWEQKAQVPEVYFVVQNAVLMEYVGSEKQGADLLENVILSEKKARQVWQKVVENMHCFLKAGVVHGDLSAFNILYWQGEIVIIDFPQSSDINKDKRFREVLRADVKNTAVYFQKYFEIDVEATCQELLKDFSLNEFW